MTTRLPAGLEASALLRQVSAAGGFATVLAKGDSTSGTILVVLVDNGRNSRLYERLPRADGERIWQCTKYEDPENPHKFVEYLERRRQQDSDVWIVELDILQGERFIGLPPLAG